MKAEYLIKKCLEREACFGPNPCPNISYCELFKDLYGCVPSKVKNLTEAEREAVSKRAKDILRKLEIFTDLNEMNGESRKR